MKLYFLTALMFFSTSLLAVNIEKEAQVYLEGSNLSQYEESKFLSFVNSEIVRFNRYDKLDVYLENDELVELSNRLDLKSFDALRFIDNCQRVNNTKLSSEHSYNMKLKDSIEICRSELEGFRLSSCIELRYKEHGESIAYIKEIKKVQLSCARRERSTLHNYFNEFRKCIAPKNLHEMVTHKNCFKDRDPFLSLEANMTLAEVESFRCEKNLSMNSHKLFNSSLFSNQEKESIYKRFLGDCHRGVSFNQDELNQMIQDKANQFCSDEFYHFQGSKLKRSQKFKDCEMRMKRDYSIHVERPKCSFERKDFFTLIYFGESIIELGSRIN